MPDLDRSSVPEGALTDQAADESAGEPTRRWTRLEAIAAVIASLLAVGVVVVALDMKFEADQARWQQRQTCLDWYQLQAEYGVGPWFDKLPLAAADCGGGETDDGEPAIPGGSAPALRESELPADEATVPTTVAPADEATVPTTVAPLAP